MNQNNGEIILNHYEKFLGYYSDVKVFGDEKRNVQMLIYNKIFDECLTVASLGISKYLEGQFEVIMSVDSDFESAYTVLANAIFYMIQNQKNIYDGCLINGIENIDKSFFERHGKSAVYFTYPFCFPEGFYKNGEITFLLAFFISEEEVNFIKQNGVEAFEEYLEASNIDVFEIDRD